jgi:hypothetical protein
MSDVNELSIKRLPLRSVTVYVDFDLSSADVTSNLTGVSPMHSVNSSPVIAGPDIETLALGFINSGTTLAFLT